MTAALFIDLAVLLALALLGILFTRAVLGHTHASELLALSFPLGAGTLSFALFLLSWAGVPLSLGVVAVAYLALVALALPLLWLVRAFRLPESKDDQGQSQGGMLTAFILCLVVLVILLAFVLALGQSYSSWDAIAIWSVKGYGIAKEGTIFAAREWGAHGLAYPLNIPILISLFKMIDGDVLPGSKLIFAGFYGSLVAGCFWFFRRRGLEGTAAAAGALFVATLPAVFEYGTNGYANHPFSCYLVLGALAQIEGLLGKRPRELVLSGFLLGLACWTRPEGVFMVPMVALVVLLSARVHLKRWATVGPTMIPILGFAVPWVLFSQAFPTQDHMTQAFVAIREALTTMDVNLGALYWIARYGVRQAIEPSSWGVLVPALAVLAVFRLRRQGRSLLPLEATVLAAALAACASMIGFYYIVSLIGDVSYWLGTGVDRMFQAVGILMGVFVVLLAWGSSTSPVTTGPEDSARTDGRAHDWLNALPPS